MAKIHFVDHTGETRIIDVENGATVMEAAIRNAIPGIEAECGGACACATCHVYVDEAWREKVGAPIADGRGHAGFRLRRAAEFAAVVPDQGQRRTRRSRGVDAGAAGLRARFATSARAHARDAARAGNSR